MGLVPPTILQSIHKPAPRWFRIVKKLLNNTVTFVIAILMLFGHRADDTILLIIKLSQSFLMEQLDTFMSNGEVYADISQVKKSELQPVMEVKPVDKGTGNGSEVKTIILIILSSLLLS